MNAHATDDSDNDTNKISAANGIVFPSTENPKPRISNGMPSAEARKHFEETLAQGPRSEQIAADIYKSQSMFQRSVTKNARETEQLMGSSEEAKQPTTEK